MAQKDTTPASPRHARRLLRGVLFAAVVVCVLAGTSYTVMFAMPGRSHQGPLPQATKAQRAIAKALRATVTHLAQRLGPRNTSHINALQKAQGYIESQLRAMGYKPRRIGFRMKAPGKTHHNKWVYNIEASIKGTTTPSEILVVGAHYDSAFNAPGANDNASGMAALLALAKALRQRKFRRTLRFVAFVNEEPPYFRTSRMGSLYYARRCQGRNDDIKAMLSLETIGYYKDTAGSQRYPWPLGLLYPSQGNFIGFVSDVGSRELVRAAIGAFRKHARFPSEGVATFGLLPGIGWSDHWAFWQAGYQAIMVTDTAPYRDPHYHTRQDTPDKLDYLRMARVVEGLHHVIARLDSF